jgi:Sugar (and other) transporter
MAFSAVEGREVSSVPKQQDVTKLIVATSIGNALEWYDIAVYGYFAIYVSKAFFPNDDPTTSLLLTFGTFGLSYLARPIGGVMLGAYADRYGRKASLMVSIVMMTFGTLSLALMPTYATIGLLTDRGHPRASGAGLFRRRRVRKLDRVSGGAYAAPAWLRRKLAIREPGAEWIAGIGIRRLAYLGDEPRRPAILGLAHSLPVRCADWADRHLHPKQYRRRDCAAGCQTRLRGG